MHTVYAPVPLAHLDNNIIIMDITRILYYVVLAMHSTVYYAHT